MKTAISMPDEVFAAADAAARRAGVSRSRFFVTAIRLFLREHSDDDITERLNEIYAGAESRLDSALTRMQIAAIRRGSHW